MERASTKKQRHALLLQKIQQNPFLKDEELARAFKVSVATIRFDRAELGISEYRERIKKVARDEYNGKTRSPEMLDINPLHDGISILQTDDTMTFNGTNIVKGQAIFAFAENLAISVIEAKAALVKVANVKYIREVRSGDKLLAKSEVKRIKNNEYIVWVKIKANMAEVFRGKFMLKTSDDA
ncbi:MAG: transcription factor FapR [Clostridia bacterium]|nr:transcription factor FapR [Clostridia bacterium]